MKKIEKLLKLAADYETFAGVSETKNKSSEITELFPEELDMVYAASSMPIYPPENKDHK